MELLTQLLEQLRRNHLEVEDGWYSCAAHPDYFGPDKDGKCDCGADHYNEILDRCIDLSAQDKGWISVEDRLPKLSQPGIESTWSEEVLIHHDIPLRPHTGRLFLRDGKEERRWVLSDMGANIPISNTAWMPLPDPPTR